MKMLALISQLAIAMLTAVLISGAIGYGIDSYFGTNIFIFFLILGVAGGYKACYNIICKFLGRRSLFESDTGGESEHK
ncbi:MAG: AtpZ/AtpI family protein [Lachnospiraceae bacterium]|nr:AtpZ/AtpI family protein [Lachnospiraceae bacterium]MDE6626834.1 AtpZ/AtpI family protein [Lachnospiraceae bacterium]